MSVQQGMIHRSKRRAAATILAAVLLSSGMIAAPGLGHTNGITLKVFGGSGLDELAPRQPPDQQKKIQQEVIDGFLKANPDVSAVEWDAQGPLTGTIQRAMTAKLAGQEMDLIACSAFYTNGAFVRRKLVMPITDKIKPFQDKLTPRRWAPSRSAAKFTASPSRRSRPRRSSTMSICLKSSASLSRRAMTT